MRQVAVRLNTPLTLGANEAADNRVVWVSRRSAYFISRNGDAVLVNAADAVSDGELLSYTAADRMRLLNEAANALGPVPITTPVAVGIPAPVTGAGLPRQATPQIGPTRAATY